MDLENLYQQLEINRKKLQEITGQLTLTVDKISSDTNEQIKRNDEYMKSEKDWSK